MRKAPGDPTKRPVPELWRHWRAEVDGIRRTLTEYRRIDKALHTPAVRGQVRYFRARLAHLLAHEPEV